jgi:hypothetical protein
MLSLNCHIFLWNNIQFPAKKSVEVRQNWVYSNTFKAKNQSMSNLAQISICWHWTPFWATRWAPLWCSIEQPGWIRRAKYKGSGAFPCSALLKETDWVVWVLIQHPVPSYRVLLPHLLTLQRQIVTRLVSILWQTKHCSEKSATWYYWWWLRYLLISTKLHGCNLEGYCPISFSNFYEAERYFMGPCVRKVKTLKNGQVCEFHLCWEYRCRGSTLEWTMRPSAIHWSYTYWQAWKSPSEGKERPVSSCQNSLRL